MKTLTLKATSIASTTPTPTTVARVVRARWRRVSQVWRSLTMLTLMATILAAVLVGLALRALRPAPGEWQHRMQLGPWSVGVSVPVMLRWATHPLALSLLDGRSVSLASGRWHMRVAKRGAAESIAGAPIVAECAPCSIHLSALGPAAIRVSHARLDVTPTPPQAWQGTLVLSDDADDALASTDLTSRRQAVSGADRAAVQALGRVVLSWRTRLDATGMAIQVSMPPTNLTSIVRVFESQTSNLRRGALRGGDDDDGRSGDRDGGSDDPIAMPRFKGTIAFEARARFVGGTVGATLGRWEQVDIEPRFEGIEVAGLGTEALLDVTPPSSCRRANAAASVEGVSGWLPKAVIAAEDQRFYEHAGFDVQAWREAVRSNQFRINQHHGAQARGASTLTQQVAKIVFVGDERSATRKMREWLYAVEMERTLGKARILQLYLALAPWGPNVCGAHAAARKHLGKSANQLKPHEAAWLASLLQRPDAKLAKLKADPRAEHARTATIIEGMRPLRKAERAMHAARLNDWSPGDEP